MSKIDEFSDFYPLDRKEWREWLRKNHAKSSGIWFVYYKKQTGKPRVTYDEAVEEALCFGWIDGVRRSIDAESYSIRFTPRKAKSIWSAVNIKKVAELIEKELMQSAGLAAFAKREESKSKIYAYENAPAELSDEFEMRFKANKKAREFFSAQAPSYQRRAIHWIMTAKQATTRESRLGKLINESENGRKI
ncbi:MAG: YdeI/OmpD-associated family protein [Acidobacteria bacterium]|nr:YdeI/OmpD-associated family protein [Acidobacteriota bacterium]